MPERTFQAQSKACLVSQSDWKGVTVPASAATISNGGNVCVSKYHEVVLVGMTCANYQSESVAILYNPVHLLGAARWAR